ncbi:MAG: L-lactate permease [Tannerella sp.]|jgi:lactate permease|nr:L-lactate permease [Tannerella sp.]
MIFLGEFTTKADTVGGSIWWTACVALIPILYLFWALAVQKMKGYVAGLTALLVTFLLAIFVFRMPVAMTTMITSYGALYGLVPIGWIILTAIFLYKIAVKTGQFEIIRSSIVAITDDRRLQAIIIAFCFGAFLEGSAGFGAPVVISAALLIGLGFKPLYAAGLCLIANTVPVAFGSIGIPITTFGNYGYDVPAISAMVGRQLSLISLIVPFYLVLIMVGWKKTVEVLPAILISGGTFALVQFLVSSYVGPELPNILSSLASIIVLAVFLRFWKPKNAYYFADEKQAEKSNKQYTGGQILKAWSPYIILTVLVTLWGMPQVKTILNDKALTWIQDVPAVMGHLFNVAGKPTVLQFSIPFLGLAGTAVLFSAIITKFIVGMSWKDFAKTFGETCREMAFPLITIMSVLALSNIANYTGMMMALAATLANSGVVFAFLSPVLGWVGVFVTGSDTAANNLFGPLQFETANSVGMDPTLALAANASGGVTGKMISPQSIAVACAAVGLGGKESDLFRFTVKHSFILLLLLCVLTFLQSNILSFMVPS